MEMFKQGECQSLCDESAVVVFTHIFTLLFFCFFLQKSKEEKKKKKHKHEEKREDLLGGQADEPVVESEETNEVAVPPTSTSAEVCMEQGFPTLQQSLYPSSDSTQNFYEIV